MRPDSPLFRLDSSSGKAVYLQVVDAFILAIRRGLLRPGQVLPGSRELARHFDVSRTTVLAAFRELEAEGWLDSRERSGTFIAELLPDPIPEPGAPSPASFRLDELDHERLPPVTERAVSGVFDLREGIPDLRLLGVDVLGRAYRRAVARNARDVLTMGDPLGFPPLRRSLAEFLRERRGMVVEPDQILVARSPWMAIDLVARVVLRPGDGVAVEDPGNRKIWDALRHSGIRLVPVPVDGEGLRLDELESAAGTEGIRMLLLSNRQYPTTADLSDERRKRLAPWAAERRLLIVEDDSEFGLVFQGQTALPVAAQEGATTVLYLVCLNRLLAPGLTLTFLVGSPGLVETLARLQARLGWRGDQVQEYAMAELLADGGFARILMRQRQAGAERCAALSSALRERFGSHLEFQQPAGGTALWARLPEGCDTAAWARACRERGVMLHPGKRWSFRQEDLPFVRLGFSAHNPEELREAVGRLALEPLHSP